MIFLITANDFSSPISWAFKKSKIFGCAFPSYKVHVFDTEAFLILYKAAKIVNEGSYYFKIAAYTDLKWVRVLATQQEEVVGYKSTEEQSKSVVGNGYGAASWSTFPNASDYSVVNGTPAN